jgi:hypothetical protein
LGTFMHAFMYSNCSLVYVECICRIC